MSTGESGDDSSYRLTDRHGLRIPETGSGNWDQPWAWVMELLDERLLLAGPAAELDTVEPTNNTLYLATDTGEIWYGTGGTMDTDATWESVPLTSPHGNETHTEEYATTTELSTLSTDVSAHTSDTTNPHSVTASQAGALSDSGGSVSGAIDLSSGNFLDHLRITRSGASYDLTPTTSGGGGLVLTRESEDGHDVESRLSWVKRSGSGWTLERGDQGEFFYHSGNLDPASYALDADLTTHESDTANPHSVTAAQTGALPESGGTVTGDVTVNGTVSATDLDGPLEGLRRNEFALNTRTFELISNGAGSWWRIARVDAGGDTNDSRVNITIDGSGPYGGADHRLNRAFFNSRDGVGTLNYFVEGEPSSQNRADMVFTQDGTTGECWLYIRANGFLAANVTIQHTDRFGQFDFEKLNSDAATIPAEVEGKISHDTSTIEPGMSKEMGGLHLHDGLEVDADATIGGSATVTGDITTGGVSVATDDDLSTHTTDTTNPHGVTATQAGALPESGGTLSGDLAVTGGVSTGAGSSVLEQFDIELTNAASQTTRAHLNLTRTADAGGGNIVLSGLLDDPNANAARSIGVLAGLGATSIQHEWAANGNYWAAGDIHAAGTMTAGGNTVYHEGNLDPSTYALDADLTTHESDTANPHQVTAAQAGAVESDSDASLNSASISTFLSLTPLAAEPTTPTSGMIAIQDGVGWDPAGTAQEDVVAYINGAWAPLS